MTSTESLGSQIVFAALSANPNRIATLLNRLDDLPWADLQLRRRIRGGRLNDHRHRRSADCQLSTARCRGKNEHHHRDTVSHFSTESEIQEAAHQ